MLPNVGKSGRGARGSRPLLRWDCVLDLAARPRIECDAGLKVCALVKTQVVVLEQSAIDIQRQVAIETCEDRMRLRRATTGIDMAQSPSDAPSIAVVCECVRSDGQGKQRRQTERGTRDGVVVVH